MRLRRALLIFGALVAAPILALGPALSAQADIPASVATYESHVYGTGVHVVGYTDAYPNFSTGAVDNHYPLARAHQDGSPLSEAVATYSDAGPAALTVAACTKSDPSQCPQKPGALYANAHYPGGPAQGHVDSCTASDAAKQQLNPCPAKDQPAAYANVAASELAATASGYYAGGGTQPFSGAAAESRTTVRPDGTLVVTSHATLAGATFGPIKITKVDVTVTATSSNGAATADAVVTVGSVTASGQPVAVTDQGTTIMQQQVVPCPGGAAPIQAPGGLPVNVQTNPGCVPQIENETIRVYTASPVKKVSGNHATVAAAALHVVITQPGAPGAPNQRVEYVLGEAFADAVLSPATVSGSTGAPPPDTTDTGTATGVGTDLGPSELAGGGGAEDMPADGATGPDAAPIAAVNPSVVFVAANRKPLVYLFLLWESVVMAAAAAWVWTRRMRARLRGPELAS